MNVINLQIRLKATRHLNKLLAPAKKNVYISITNDPEIKCDVKLGKLAQIRINQKIVEELTYDEVMSIFLHEIGHVLDDAFRYRTRHDREYFADYMSIILGAEITDVINSYKKLDILYGKPEESESHPDDYSRLAAMCFYYRELTSDLSKDTIKEKIHA